jgi:hypothetical protein
MTTSCVLDSLTTSHGEAGLPTSTAQRGGLREVGARGRSLGLRSGDLLDQACSQRQEALYSLGMVSSGRTTLMLALSQAPKHVEGEEQERLGTPRFCNPCIGFSQASEHVEGRAGQKTRSSLARSARGRLGSARLVRISSRAELRF